MEPVLALALSGCTIHEIQDHNLAAAVQAVHGDVPAAQKRFPTLFEFMTRKIAPLPEDEFWTALADAAEVPEAATQLRQTFLEHFDYRPGMQDLLTTLREAGVRTYIWTSMPNSWMDALHKQLGLEDLVTAYVNCQNLPWRKPEPDFFQRGALDPHGLTSDQIIYVSPHAENREAAKLFTAQQLPVLPPDQILQHVRQLLRADASAPVMPGVIVADR